MTDVWDEEGFGAEDEWEGDEAVEPDLGEEALPGSDELEDAELDDADDDTLSDEEL
jgi:hypothetical protein